MVFNQDFYNSTLDIDDEDERLSKMDVISKDVQIPDKNEIIHDLSCSRPAHVEGNFL